MGKYAIDGVKYEIDDRLDLNQAVEQIRASSEHAISVKQLEPGFAQFGYHDDRTPEQAGKDFESYGPLRQAGEAAVAPLETIAAMGTAGTTGLGAGAYQAWKGLLTGGPNGRLDAAAEGFHKGMEAGTYTPRTSGGQYLTGLAGEAFDKVRSGAGTTVQDFAGELLTPILGSSEFPDSPDNQLPRDVAQGLTEPLRAGAEASVDIAAFGAGPKALHGKYKARQIAKEGEAQAQKLLEEALQVEAKLKQERMQNDLTNEQWQSARQTEFPGFDELRKEAEPRNPYNLPESLRKELEAELNPPVEQRMLGQDELFGQKPLGVADREIRPPSQPLPYTPESPSITPEGRMAQAQGPDALRSGAAEPLQMDMLNYPQGEAKPRLMGPQATMEPTVPEIPYTGPSRARDMRALDAEGYDRSVRARIAAVRAAQSKAAEVTNRVVPDEGVGSPGSTGKLTPGFSLKLYDYQYANGGKDAKPIGRTMLELVKDHSEIPYYKELAKKLLSDKTWNPDFQILPLETIRSATNLPSTAAYVPKRNAMWLSPKEMGVEPTLLHEAIHAATYHALEKNRGTRFSSGAYSYADHATPAAKRMYQLYNNFKSYWDETPGLGPDRPYGLKDIHEFIAEGFTNPEFQAMLARTKLSPQLRSTMGHYKSMWDAFVRAVSKLLGFEGKDNYLSELIRAGAELMGENSNARALFGEKDTSPIPSMMDFKEFKQLVKDKNIAVPEKVLKAMYDKVTEPRPEPLPDPHTALDTRGAREVQKQYADRRPIEEMAKDLKAVRDDSLFDLARLNTVGKIIQGRFISKGNPLLSWVSSNVHWVKQESIAQANKLLHGSNRRKPDPGTYNYIWNDLKTSEDLKVGDNRVALNEVGQALNNAVEQLTDMQVQAKAREVIGRDLTSKEMQAYKDRIRINKQVLRDVNAKLKEEGKQTIHELPHYWSPAVFDGPFKIRFVKDGETVMMDSFYVKPNVRKLKKAFPEYDIVEVPETVRGGEFDWGTFDAILRQVTKEARDPAARAIREGMRRMGFGKHGLKRKGVKGAAGTEGGKRGVRAYEQTSEQYIRGAYDFLANRELDKMHNAIESLPDASHLPHTKAWALEAIDTARGGSNKGFEYLSNMLSATVSGTITIGTLGKLQLPQRFTRDLLRHANKIKTTQLLGFWNPVMIGAQLIQAPTFMPPKLLAMATEAGMSQVTVFNALARSLKEYGKWNRSKDAIELAKTGAFDATFKYDWSTYAGDSNPQFRRTLADHLTGLSTLLWVESNVVRRPAAHMFLEMLREIGYDKVAKDKTEIYKVARELTDHYMVSMRFHEKPHVFSRTGLAGMAVGPLQSFATTWLGMFREYSTLAIKGLLKGQVASTVPFMAYMATSLLTAGMLGMVGIKEWDALAKLLNDNFDWNVPSGTEFVLSKFKSPAMRYGLLSEAMPFNMQMGPTFAAPSLTGGGAPGVALLGDVARAGSMAVRSSGVFGETSKPTDVEWRETLKAVMPRVGAWGAMERYYTPEGAPYAEGSGQAGPYTRTPEDWTARYLGSYTTNERNAKNEYYAARNNQPKLQRGVDRAIDIILSGRRQEDLPKIWKELQEKKFTQQEIASALKAEVRRRLMESDQRELKSGSPRAQRLYLLYQQLGGDRAGQQ